MSEPVFAVVGHPNKGKSSLVATLSADDSVRIGREAGTTVECRRFPMRVDEETLYVLVDTPGFQRARKALAWMTERETTAAAHPDVVADFVATHREGSEFPDECRLLAPLLEGAGVLYIVDGSVPYGPEYEAEMKILRWTGRPRMGIINPIGPADYIEPWKTALGQYFNVVRVFDAVRSDFGKHVDLLRAFGELQESWRTPLTRAVRALEADRARRQGQAARFVAQCIADMLTLRIEERISEATRIDPLKPRLLKQYHSALQKIENRTRRQVQEAYDHHEIERQEEHLPLLDQDLFSEETWRMFGLNKKQLLSFGAIGGAAIGGAIDAASGGFSFFTGTVIGTMAGAGASFLALRSLARVKILTLPLAGRHLVVEPIRNPNFPHVVYGRARLHHAMVANRTHAERGAMTLDEAARFRLRPLCDEERSTLDRMFRTLRRNANSETALNELIAAITTQFSDDEHPA
jgi:hypothetical protein